MILHTTARCITHPPCEWTGTTDKSAEKHGRETGHATIVETIPMRAPRRIQMSRKHPWRADNPDAVIVARPSRWGNPFEIGSTRWIPVDENGTWSKEPHPPLTREQAVECFRLSAVFDAREFPGYYAALAGRDLACWCALVDADGNPVPCHADVLLELANE